MGRTHGAGAQSAPAQPSRLGVPGDRVGALHLADRTWTRIRSRGPAEVARLIAARAKEAAHSGDTLIVLARPVAADSGDSEAGLVFRPATSADGGLYARDIGTDSERSFKARLSPSTSCFVVESEDRLLHASWVTTSGAWTRELRAYLCPPPGTAYIYESFTRPDARGRGLYPFALRRIASHSAGRGLETLWVAIEAGNPSSLRAVAKAGFRGVSQLEYRRRMGRLAVQIPMPGEPCKEGLRVDT